MPTLVALLALGVLVLVHELGHLVAARAVGARAVVFSVGFGLPLYGFRAGGQRWVLGAIPWGAWLRLEGENPYQPSSGVQEVAFSELSPARRALVFLAGPAASLLLGFLLLTALHAMGTHVPVPMTVGVVEPGSEAARAALRPGDAIESVDGVPVQQWVALTRALGAQAGQPVSLGIRRGTAGFQVVVQPASDARGRGRIGIGQQYAFAREPFPRAFSAALWHSVQLVRQTAAWAGELFRGPDGSGHHGAAALLLRRLAAIRSLDAVTRALAAASIALGFLYLLPLPALDGGRLLLTAWEKQRGRPLDARVQTTLQLLSLLLAVVAVGWVALNEVRQALAAASGPAEGLRPADSGPEPHPALAVQVRLALPNGSVLLQTLDGEAAGLEGFCSVRRRSGDGDRHIPGDEHAYPMDNGQLGPGPALLGLAAHASEHPLRHRTVGLVRETHHALSPAFGAHHTGKRHQAAAGRVPHRGHHFLQRRRALHHPEESRSTGDGGDEGHLGSLGDDVLQRCEGLVHRHPEVGEQRLQAWVALAEKAEHRAHRPRGRDGQKLLLRHAGTLAGGSEVEDGERHGVETRTRRPGRK
jgi:regulator of sigma E protease